MRKIHTPRILFYFSQNYKGTGKTDKVMENDTLTFKRNQYGYSAGMD